MAQAAHTGVGRDTLLKKCIFAADEPAGLIVAVAIVRPSRKLADVSVKSVMKKWKERAFASGVDRKVVEQGAEELGATLTEHIEIVLKAMRGEPILRRTAKWGPKIYLRSQGFSPGNCGRRSE